MFAVVTMLVWHRHRHLGLAAPTHADGQATGLCTRHSFSGTSASCHRLWHRTKSRCSTSGAVLGQVTPYQAVVRSGLLLRARNRALQVLLAPAGGGPYACPSVRWSAGISQKRRVSFPSPIEERMAG